MSIITGRYPHQHGVTGNDPARRPEMTDSVFNELRHRLIGRISDSPTLPRMLAGQSYLSLQTGKWWEGSWKTAGFTHGMTRGFPERGGRHGDDGLAIGRESLQPAFDFIDAAKASGQPFFLWYAPMLPHSPHDPPERLLTKYRAPDRAESLAKYFAMCERFDETCGELLNYLDQQQMSQNTLVIYVTDNGWIQSTPEMQLPPEWKNGFAPRSKQTPYEGGVRTPVMIFWPGVIAAGERPELVSTLDVFPTVLDAIGIGHPKFEAGLSLWPLLRDGTPMTREAIFGEGFSHDIADLDDHEVSLQYRWCIRDHWKLIVSYESPPDRYSWVHAINDRQPQLYDLHNDPHETHNLTAQHPEIVRELHDRLQQEWTVAKPAVGIAVD
jgi:uncharacterized sulfatase